MDFGYMLFDQAIVGIVLSVMLFNKALVWNMFSVTLLTKLTRLYALCFQLCFE
jgi:hypothetical protein